MPRLASRLVLVLALAASGCTSEEERAKQEDIADCAERAADSHHRDALAWLSGSTQRTVGEMDPQESAAHVKALLAMGATRVTADEVTDEGPDAAAEFLVLWLPADPAKRRALFAVEKRIMSEGKEYEVAADDVGQPHACFWYDGVRKDPTR